MMRRRKTARIFDGVVSQSAPTTIYIQRLKITYALRRVLFL